MANFRAAQPDGQIAGHSAFISSLCGTPFLGVPSSPSSTKSLSPEATGGAAGDAAGLADFPAGAGFCFRGAHVDVAATVAQVPPLPWVSDQRMDALLAAAGSASCVQAAPRAWPASSGRSPRRATSGVVRPGSWSAPPPLPVLPLPREPPSHRLASPGAQDFQVEPTVWRSWTMASCSGIGGSEPCGADLGCGSPHVDSPAQQPAEEVEPCALGPSHSAAKPIGAPGVLTASAYSNATGTSGPPPTPAGTALPVTTAPLLQRALRTVQDLERLLGAVLQQRKQELDALDAEIATGLPRARGY